MQIAIALVSCAACGAAHAPKPSAAAVADAVVGKHPYFVFGVRGGDPELVAWSGAGLPVITEGRTFVLDQNANDGRGEVQAIAGTHGSGRAVEGDRPGAHLGIAAVSCGDLLAVHGRSETPPESSLAGAAPHVEEYIAVFRGLDKPLQRLAWPVLPAQLLSSTDVDGDGQRDLVTYGCSIACNVSIWRAGASGLEPEKAIASWSKHQRVVVAAVRSNHYEVVDVEPFAIRLHELEHGALREVMHVEQSVRDERSALDGPVAVGDFNHDDRVDIVVVSRGNMLYAWSGDRPVPPFSSTFSDRIRQVALVDLDRDGDDDLLVSSDSDVALYRGSPSGLAPSPSWRAHLP